MRRNDDEDDEDDEAHELYTQPHLHMLFVGSNYSRSDGSDCGTGGRGAAVAGFFCERRHCE